MTQEKADMIYHVIDESKDFYRCDVFRPHRSRLNILFRCRYDPGLEYLFLNEAKRNLLVDLDNR